MTIAFEAAGVILHHGDCIEVMRTLPDNSVDAVVTDPPYGLEFMGKDWDSFKPAGSHAKAREFRADEMVDENKRRFIASGVNQYVAGAAFEEWCTEWATEALRVLKPGGHMLAFGGSRTWHRLAAGIEDAGFEIRDSIAWLYGSGFPKSLDVSKAIDATLTVGGSSSKQMRERDMGDDYQPHPLAGTPGYGDGNLRKGADGDRSGVGSAELATQQAREWVGWGTALKPAFEPIVVARKPLTGTVANNVLEHGTGALNIDACRVEAQGRPLIVSKSESSAGVFGDGLNGSSNAGTTDAGRWPSNVVLDESQAAELDKQTGVSHSRIGKPRGAAAGDGWGMTKTGAEYDDAGGASRFFPTFRYEAKAGSDERPNYTKKALRLRDDLTAEEVDLVRARLQEAGVPLG